MEIDEQMARGVHAMVERNLVVAEARFGYRRPPATAQAARQAPTPTRPTPQPAAPQPPAPAAIAAAAAQQAELVRMAAAIQKLKEADAAKASMARVVARINGKTIKKSDEPAKSSNPFWGKIINQINERNRKLK